MGQDISQAFGLHLDRGKAGLTPNPPSGAAGSLWLGAEANTPLRAPHARRGRPDPGPTLAAFTQVFLPVLIFQCHLSESYFHTDFWNNE